MERLPEEKRRLSQLLEKSIQVAVPIWFLVLCANLMPDQNVSALNYSYWNFSTSCFPPLMTIHVVSTPVMYIHNLCLSCGRKKLYTKLLNALPSLPIHCRHRTCSWSLSRVSLNTFSTTAGECYSTSTPSFKGASTNTTTLYRIEPQ